MIIPVRCFTCATVLADKWLAYERKCKEQERAEKTEEEKDYPHNFDMNFKGKILDELGLTKVCCRRHMLTHVDLIDDI